MTLQEVICITPASIRHLRRALCPDMSILPSYSPRPSFDLATSHRPSFLYPLNAGTDHQAPQSPTGSFVSMDQSSAHFSHLSPPHSSRGIDSGWDESNTGPGLQVLCHPKNGVPMTVIYHPGPESDSGKPIKIDMLLSGEWVNPIISFDVDLQS